MGLANNSASHPVRTEIVGTVDSEQINQMRTRAMHSAFNCTGSATAQCSDGVVRKIRSAHQDQSPTLLRRQFGKRGAEFRKFEPRGLLRFSP